MITLDQNVVYVGLAFILFALLLSAGALYFLRQTNKDVKDGTPPDIVNRILDYAEFVTKLLAPGIASTETSTDDELMIKFMESRGYTVTGTAETGYVFTKAPVDETSG